MIALAGVVVAISVVLLNVYSMQDHNQIAELQRRVADLELNARTKNDG